MKNTTNFIFKIDRKKHELDATGQSVGRLATKIAYLLRGKHKPNYSPQLDNGDFVALLNIKKLKFTGKKLDQKNYYRHSGHPGGLTITPAKKLWQENPGKIVIKAVTNMLPKNKLRVAMIKRLTIK